MKKNYTIKGLITKKFLIKDKTDGTIRLNVPVEAHLTVGCSEVLEVRYKWYEEQGGLLVGRPVFENGIKILEIIESFYFDNTTKEDKRTTYEWDNVALQKKAAELLKEGLIPIFFHTHPTNKEEFASGGRIFFGGGANSSITDRINKVPFLYNGHKFIFPEGLHLSAGEDKSLSAIGFFGSGVNEDIHESRKANLQESLKKNMPSLIKKIDRKYSKVEILCIVAVLLVVIVCIIRFPKIAGGLLIAGGMTAGFIITSFQETPLNYSLIKKGATTKILLH